jgi:hypothetical protein
MPVEGYLIKRFCYDVAIAGIWWWGMYVISLFLNMIL